MHSGGALGKGREIHIDCCAREARELGGNCVWILRLDFALGMGKGLLVL